jgi:small subunit ribosomal protein S16
MLAIRFQRVGRSGHAEFRIIVQEAHRTPSSGRIVAQIGHYNPHTKVTKLDKEKAQFYIGNGAQPSTRVALLMKSEGVTLPSWVKIDASKARSVKNTDKLRKHQPAQEEPIVEEAPAVVAEESEPVAESTEA